MKVQKIRHPQRERSDHITWTVIGDDFLPVPEIENYLAFLQNIEASPNTIRAYSHHLKFFWEFLRDTHQDWRTVGLETLAQFVAWLRNPHPGTLPMQSTEAKRTEATINAVLSAVSAFYDFHAREGRVQEVPWMKVQYGSRRYKGFLHHITKSRPSQVRIIKLKAPRKVPKTLTVDQVQQILEHCRHRRDRFLVALLYETGMRIGQALNLRHADIESWDNTIRIVPHADNVHGARPKRWEPLAVAVSPDLMALYADYLVHELDDIDSDYVLVNLWGGARGQPLAYPAVLDLFARLSRKTQIVIRPHMLRHTHATELLRAGWDASLVQKRLGHAQIQTTIQIYAHLTDEDLKQAFQKYHATRKEPSTP